MTTLIFKAKSCL